VCRLLVWRKPKKRLHSRIHVILREKGEALAVPIWVRGLWGWGAEFSARCRFIQE
jgi:hypothetical protein